MEELAVWGATVYGKQEYEYEFREYKFGGEELVR